MDYARIDQVVRRGDLEIWTSATFRFRAIPSTSAFILSPLRGVAVFCLYNLEATMSEEWKKARAQYLNGLAVAIVSLAVSAVLAGAPWWALPAAGTVSLSLHWAAVRVVR